MGTRSCRTTDISSAQTPGVISSSTSRLMTTTMYRRVSTSTTICPMSSCGFASRRVMTRRPEVKKLTRKSTFRSRLAVIEMPAAPMHRRLGWESGLQRSERMPFSPSRISVLPPAMLWIVIVVSGWTSLLTSPTIRSIEKPSASMAPLVGSSLLPRWFTMSVGDENGAIFFVRMITSLMSCRVVVFS